MIRKDAVTLKQLRALAAIQKMGNLTRAAGFLHVTTPAVSTQIRLLEQNMQCQLLHRSVDGNARMTVAGQEMLRATAEIENILERAGKTVDALNAGRAGHVSLGVVSTGKYFAPRLVKKAMKDLPDLSVSLEIGNREKIIHALSNTSIDIAIMGRPPLEPEVQSDVLGHHPHVMIAAPDHPLAKKKTISYERLLKETFLLRESGSGTRILSERFLDRIGDGTPYHSIEFTTNETIKQAVIAGLGIALISAHTVDFELHAGRLISLSVEGLPIMRHWHLVRLLHHPLSPGATRYYNFLLSQTNEDRNIIGNNSLLHQGTTTHAGHQEEAKTA